eukprot:9889562-Heterocapsa_arctica.AAC.1
MNKQVAREWSDVFAALAEADWAGMGDPVDPHVFNAPKNWAAHAGACLPNLAARLTGAGKVQSVVGTYVAWFQTPKPEVNGFVNFNDVTLRVDACGTVTPVAKSSDNECYLNVRTSLAFKPSDDDVARVRRYFATTFAGNEHGRFVDMAADALALRGSIMPQRLIVYRGRGGDGKSLRTVLRHNILEGNHGFLSPACFTVEEEFRKQGGQAAHMRAVTIQECSG